MVDVTRHGEKFIVTLTNPVSRGGRHSQSVSAVLSNDEAVVLSALLQEVLSLPVYSLMEFANGTWRVFDHYTGEDVLELMAPNVHLEQAKRDERVVYINGREINHKR